MYRLLLVTGQLELLSVFEAFNDWQALGFEKPILTDDVERATTLVELEAVDAVSFSLPKDEGQAFFTVLAQHPQVKCVEAAGEPVRLRRALNTLRRQLTEARQPDHKDEVLPLLQAEFYHSLLEGALLRDEELKRRVVELALPIALDAPVSVAYLTLPSGEAYLEQIWRYGRQRLEVALRNFFERDLPEKRYVLGVMSPSEIKLMVCPKLIEPGQVLVGDMLAHIDRVQTEIKTFLDLDVRTQSLVLYDNLEALCAGQSGERVFTAS